MTSRHTKVMTLPTLTKCEWRLDVIVSTSVLTKSFQPSILMKLKLSDGTTRMFYMSVNQLHQLRYTLARSLRDLALLESKRDKTDKKPLKS